MQLEGPGLLNVVADHVHLQDGDDVRADLCLVPRVVETAHEPVFLRVEEDEADLAVRPVDPGPERQHRPDRAQDTGDSAAVVVGAGCRVHLRAVSGLTCARRVHVRGHQDHTAETGAGEGGFHVVVGAALVDEPVSLCCQEAGSGGGDVGEQGADRGGVVGMVDVTAADGHAVGRGKDTGVPLHFPVHPFGRDVLRDEVPLRLRQPWIDRVERVLLAERGGGPRRSGGGTVRVTVQQRGSGL